MCQCNQLESGRKVQFGEGPQNEIRVALPKQTVGCDRAKKDQP